MPRQHSFMPYIMVGFTSKRLLTKQVDICLLVEFFCFMPVQIMEEVTKLGRNFFNTDQQQDCVKSHNITQYGSESCTSLDM